MTHVLESALAAEAAGISVVPPAQDGSKRPDVPTWKVYQRNRADPDTIRAWYASGRTGLGFVTGEVSGNLEAIDFDDRSAYAEFKRLCADAGLDDLLSLVCKGYLEHSPNGAHILYRCEHIEGNTKLAKRGGKTLIETRSSAGYLIVAPTHGSVNASGPYEMVSGGVESIRTITPGERNNLHDIARILDESIKPADHVRHAPLADDRPGDDYNSRASWEAVLTPHGWVKVGSRMDVTSWRRPGKDHGISATTNHGGSDLLYVFSSNTDFESERGYSKFSAYGLLNHQGDFAAASSALSLLGYGSRLDTPDDEVDLSLLLAASRPYSPRPLADLTRVPGLVGDLARWIDESSIKPQPMLSLGAAIAAMSTILGNKVCTQTGLRPNVYVLGVGETGCGKERARQAISALYSDVEAGQLLGDSFASDAAVESAIAAHPTSLYLIDEIGQFLGLIKGDSPAYLKGIVSVFLKLYGASEGVYRKRTYADAQRNEDALIYNPCLSIYGTTVPSNLYSSLQKENISDGLLSRFLVFDSDDPDPHVRMVTADARRPPTPLVEGFRHWRELRRDELNSDPDEVHATPAAWEVFDALEAHMREKRKAIRGQGGDQGPYTRVRATAMKLALIRACGISTTPEITESDARWGCDLALVLTERFLEKIASNLAENRTEANVQRIVSIVKDAGEHGATKSRITRKTQGMKRGERDDAIATAIECGDVIADEFPSGGRPRLTLLHKAFVKARLSSCLSS